VRTDRVETLRSPISGVYSLVQRSVFGSSIDFARRPRYSTLFIVIIVTVKLPPREVIGSRSRG
jgi:hypothetical protein